MSEISRLTLGLDCYNVTKTFQITLTYIIILVNILEARTIKYNPPKIINIRSTFSNLWNIKQATVFFRHRIVLFHQITIVLPTRENKTENK